MFSEWFGSIFFRAKGKITPELILKDGSRIKNPKIENYEILRELMTESRIRFDDRPMILFNGTHEIKNLDKLLVSKHYKKTLQENQVAVYFFEPLTHYIPSPHEAPHIMRIDNNDEEIQQVRCFELDSLQNWAIKNNINDICVYCTDYRSWEYYQPLYPNLKLLSLDLFVSWYTDRIIFLEKRHPSDILIQQLKVDKIKYKFWSGAWRYESYRHFITSFLAGRDLAKNNHVSFFFKISNDEFKNRLWFDWKNFEKKHPDVANIVLTGNTKLQKIVPLSFEVEKPMALGGWASDPDNDTQGLHNIRDNQNPVNSYEETFCAIVQESRFTQPWPNISEKTINAITNLRPFILCAAPGTLQMLRDMGFLTFGDFWPEDYDKIVSNQDRLARICEIIDYINSFTLDELKEMYRNMEHILFHNNEQIKNVTQFYNGLNEELMRNFVHKDG